MNWYQNLLHDIKILEFDIIQKKWRIGERINRDILKFDKSEYGSKTISNLAKDFGVSPPNLYQCLKFSKKYSYKQIEKFKGKSWFYITQNYLYFKTEKKREIEILPKHKNFVAEKVQLYKKGNNSLKNAIVIDCKDKIKLYHTILQIIKSDAK